MSGETRRIDLALAAAVAVAVAVRLPLVLLWPDDPCQADECGYLAVARAIVRGEGVRPFVSWVWAPLQPMLLAFFDWAFHDPWKIRGFQIGMAGGTVWVLQRLGARLAGPRAGLAAAWIFALHPTFTFLAGRLWTEPLYGSLLAGAVLALAWAREGRWPRALLPGGLLALCVLTRGMAAYLLPLFVLALAWPNPGERPAWRPAAVLAACAVLLVTPYSLYATGKHRGFMITDTTLGRMMYLGNNDFGPRTFDYGSASRIWIRRSDDAVGRPRCRKQPGAVAYNRCETRNGIAWIRAHPVEFLERVPVRAAQLLNPNSFLTRHARTGRYPGMGDGTVFAISLGVVLASYLVVLGGSIGAWAWARGPVGLLLVGITGYHVAVVCALAGLTRYRVPWEMLWVVFAGALVAHPLASRRRLGQSRWLLAGAAVTTIVVFGLMLWYLPAGLVR